MLNGAIFDMDGLMIDTEKLLVKFWRQSAREFGYNMTVQNVLDIRSLSRKYAVPKLRGIFGEQFDFEGVRARRIELMDAYIDEHGFEVKKGLFELLDYLRSHSFKITVATATDRKRTEMYLNRINALDYFDEIVCGDMVKNGKPKPDIYLTAAEALGLRPNECAALEDSPNGIISAKRAGCRVIIMIPDLSQPDDKIMSQLDAVYESLDKAVEFFEKDTAHKEALK
ncbi:MAG: HAD family hydrolase [Ruminococcus sp.]|nr:HAD family hydrolase [Ruminococcus sp.]